jgi:hypothetical protein
LFICLFSDLHLFGMSVCCDHHRFREDLKKINRNWMNIYSMPAEKVDERHTRSDLQYDSANLPWTFRRCFFIWFVNSIVELFEISFVSDRFQFRCLFLWCSFRLQIRFRNTQIIFPANVCLCIFCN